MVTTAARISTALALRWDDIDPEAGIIHFRRRLSEGEVLPGVKRSRTSKDEAPLLPEVWAELEAHRKRMKDVERRSGLVFPSEYGHHHTRTILKLPFQRIRKLANITKRFTPHGCRRTAAAMYRRAAGSAVAMAIAGHLTDRMHQHYAVVANDEKQVAASRAFGGLTLLTGGMSGGKEPETQTAGKSAALTGRNVS